MPFAAFCLMIVDGSIVAFIFLAICRVSKIDDATVSQIPWVTTRLIRVEDDGNMMSSSNRVSLLNTVQSCACGCGLISCH